MYVCDKIYSQAHIENIQKPSSPRRNLCTHTEHFPNIVHSSMEILRWVSLLPYKILWIFEENITKKEQINLIKQQLINNEMKFSGESK